MLAAPQTEETYSAKPAATVKRRAAAAASSSTPSSTKTDSGVRKDDATVSHAKASPVPAPATHTSAAAHPPTPSTATHLRAPQSPAGPRTASFPSQPPLLSQAAASHSPEVIEEPIDTMILRKERLPTPIESCKDTSHEKPSATRFRNKLVAHGGFAPRFSKSFFEARGDAHPPVAASTLAPPRSLPSEPTTSALPLRETELRLLTLRYMDSFALLTPAYASPQKQKVTFTVRHRPSDPDFPWAKYPSIQAADGR